MILSDEDIRRLRALPGGVFTVAQVRAAVGDINDPPRKVCVYAKIDPSKAWSSDRDDEIVQFNEGDEIELIPSANWGSQHHGPHCACERCAEDRRD